MKDRNSKSHVMWVKSHTKTAIPITITVGELSPCPAYLRRCKRSGRVILQGYLAKRWQTLLSCYGCACRRRCGEMAVGVLDYREPGAWPITSVAEYNGLWRHLMAAIWVSFSVSIRLKGRG